MDTVGKVVAGCLIAFVILGGFGFFEFVYHPSQRAEAVRDRIKTGMTSKEVVEILEHADLERPRLYGRHCFALQALDSSQKAVCAAGGAPPDGDCEEYRCGRDVLGRFSEALAAKVRGAGKAEVWKAEIHADFHIFMETEYLFTVSFGRDGKVAAVGKGDLVTQ